MEELAMIFALAFIYGSWGFVFTRLQEGGEIFDFVPDMVTKVITWGKHSAYDDWSMNRWQHTVWKWATCGKCHAGITAFLFYPGQVLPNTLLGYFAFITLSILTAIILTAKLE